MGGALAGATATCIAVGQKDVTSKLIRATSAAASSFSSSAWAIEAWNLSRRLQLLVVDLSPSYTHSRTLR